MVKAWWRSICGACLDAGKICWSLDLGRKFMIFFGEFERGEGKTGRVYEGRNFREIGVSAAGF